jgi:protein MpaA
MTTIKVGQTVNNIPILAHVFGTYGAKILLVGGVHGNEPEGVVLAKGLLENFLESFTLRLQVMIVPELNVDGLLKLTRCNANGVDLNRNLPTTDWSPIAHQPKYQPGPNPGSEPETKSFIKLFEQFQPELILSFHSYDPMLNTNGPCEDVADVIAKHTGYKIVPDMGYPTPGALGRYAGIERKVGTLTYEIERGLKFSEIIRVHVPAVIEGLKVRQLGL